MNNRGPTIDPWGIPCFIVLLSEVKFLVLLGDFGGHVVVQLVEALCYKLEHHVYDSL